MGSTITATQKPAFCYKKMSIKNARIIKIPILKLELNHIGQLDILLYML